MRRFFVCVLAVLMLILCGCSTTETDDSALAKDRLTLSSMYGNIISGCYIIRDNETGVCYLRALDGGVCVMVNPDGSPYIDKDWRDVDD